MNKMKFILFCFYMYKFNKNSFRACERETSNL